VCWLGGCRGLDWLSCVLVDGRETLCAAALEGNIWAAVIGRLLRCGVYKAALLLLIFMFDTAFIDSWQRCPWSLFTLSHPLSPCLALSCPALPCLASPSFSWFTHSLLLETAQRPSINGHCIRHPPRSVGRGSIKAISTGCRRTLSSFILLTQLLNSPTPQLRDCSPSQPPCCATAVSLHHNRLSASQPSLCVTTISLLHNHLSVTTHSPSHLTLSSQHTLSSQTPHHHTHSQPTPSS
jgi:hypothetical protein